MSTLKGVRSQMLVGSEEGGTVWCVYMYMYVYAERTYTVHNYDDYCIWVLGDGNAVEPLLNVDTLRIT